MNAIPASAIKRIEVLRDGASAQYGSDALAGVINIVLKEGYEGGFRSSYGSTYEGDGETFDVNLPANLPESLFTDQDRSIIETWQPKDRVSMSTRYVDVTIAVDYSVHRYGAYTVIEGGISQTYAPKYLTDIQLSYGLGE